MEFTYNIYKAEELGIFESDYYILCEETQYLIGFDTLRAAKRELKHADSHDFGQDEYLAIESLTDED